MSSGTESGRMSRNIRREAEKYLHSATGAYDSHVWSRYCIIIHTRPPYCPGWCPPHDRNVRAGEQ